VETRSIIHTRYQTVRCWSVMSVLYVFLYQADRTQFVK